VKRLVVLDRDEVEALDALAVLVDHAVRSELAPQHNERVTDIANAALLLHQLILELQHTRGSCLRGSGETRERVDTHLEVRHVQLINRLSLAAIVGVNLRLQL